MRRRTDDFRSFVESAARERQQRAAVNGTTGTAALADRRRERRGGGGWLGRTRRAVMTPSLTCWPLPCRRSPVWGPCRASFAKSSRKCTVFDSPNGRAAGLADVRVLDCSAQH